MLSGVGSRNPAHGVYSCNGGHSRNTRTRFFRSLRVVYRRLNTRRRMSQTFVHRSHDRKCRVAQSVRAGSLLSARFSRRAISNRTIARCRTVASPRGAFAAPHAGLHTYCTLARIQTSYFSFERIRGRCSQEYHAFRGNSHQRKLHVRSRVLSWVFDPALSEQSTARVTPVIAPFSRLRLFAAGGGGLMVGECSVPNLFEDRKW